MGSKQDILIDTKTDTGAKTQPAKFLYDVDKDRLANSTSDKDKTAKTDAKVAPTELPTMTAEFAAKLNSLARMENVRFSRDGKPIYSKEDMKSFQTFLKSYGEQYSLEKCKNLSANGTWGKETAAAAKEFQDSVKSFQLEGRTFTFPKAQYGAYITPKTIAALVNSLYPGGVITKIEDKPVVKPKDSSSTTTEKSAVVTSAKVFEGDKVIIGRKSVETGLTAMGNKRREVERREREERREKREEAIAARQTEKRSGATNEKKVARVSTPTIAKKENTSSPSSSTNSDGALTKSKEKEQNIETPALNASGAANGVKVQKTNEQVVRESFDKLRKWLPFE